MNNSIKKLNITLLSTLLVCASSACTNKNNTTSNNEISDTVENTADPLEGTFVNSYEYYEYSKLDFSFVIAEVQLNEGASLSDVKTSTNIDLTDVQSYVTTLEDNQFYLGKKNVWFTLPTSGNFDGNIFIPITDKSLTSIELTYNNQSVTLDLTSNEGSMKDLMFNSTKDTFTDEKTYQMNVSDIFEITDQDMYEDGTQLVLPSSARVFTFKVTVQSLEGSSVEVTSATLQDDSGFNAEAEENITSAKYENMIGKTIKEKDEANLFFIVLDHENKLQVTSGTLTIYLNGVETPIEVRYE